MFCSSFQSESVETVEAMKNKAIKKLRKYVKPKINIFSPILCDGMATLKRGQTSPRCSWFPMPVLKQAKITILKT